MGRLLCQHSRVAEKVILASPLEYPLPLLHKVMGLSFLFIEFSCSVTWGYQFDFFSCLVRIRSSVWVGGNGFWACVPYPVKLSSSYPASSPYSFSLITTLHLLWNSYCPRSRDILLSSHSSRPGFLRWGSVLVTPRRKCWLSAHSLSVLIGLRLKI